MAAAAHDAGDCAIETVPLHLCETSPLCLRHRCHRWTEAGCATAWDGGGETSLGRAGSESDLESDGLLRLCGLDGVVSVPHPDLGI